MRVDPIETDAEESVKAETALILKRHWEKSIRFVNHVF